jgi:hypothetical protein
VTGCHFTYRCFSSTAFILLELVTRVGSIPLPPVNYALTSTADGHDHWWKKAICSDFRARTGYSIDINDAYIPTKLTDQWAV